MEEAEEAAVTKPRWKFAALSLDLRSKVRTALVAVLEAAKHPIPAANEARQSSEMTHLSTTVARKGKGAVNPPTTVSGATTCLVHQDNLFRTHFQALARKTFRADTSLSRAIHEGPQLLWPEGGIPSSRLNPGILRDAHESRGAFSSPKPVVRAKDLVQARAEDNTMSNCDGRRDRVRKAGSATTYRLGFFLMGSAGI
ncbi:hypothetical protein Bbelb_106140 [Branchiostoma belcheri]|nr:hypothetical protein Bbelb_106140 [Branchiostoma belcheri]